MDEDIDSTSLFPLPALTLYRGVLQGLRLDFHPDLALVSFGADIMQIGNDSGLLLSLCLLRFETLREHFCLVLEIDYIAPGAASRFDSSVFAWAHMMWYRSGRQQTAGAQTGEYGRR